jgi:diguanylate cyclase (GGDEF)-like protein/PAS domain S-box-containing protein
MGKTRNAPTAMARPKSGRLGGQTADSFGGAAVDSGADSVLDTETVERMYTKLLSEFPEAPVAAVKIDGLFAAMPASFPLGRHPVLQGRSGLDLVIPEDRGTVIAAWDSMLATATAQCLVHLAADPSLVAMFHYFDARATHDVCLLVIAPADLSDAAVRAPIRTEIASVMPRFATMKKNERGVVLEVDEATTQILGWPAEQLVGHRTLAFTHPEDHALAIENWMDLLAEPGPARRVRVRYRRRDESWVWFEITNHNLLDDPDHRCVISGMLDISDEMAATEALRAREQLLDRLAEALPLGLFQIDAGRHVVYTNDRLHEIVGIERAPTVGAQLATLRAADRPALEEALEAVLLRGLQAEIEVALELPSASQPRLCTMSLRALSDDTGTINGAIVCVADVTDAARMREELQQRATFDHLTDCYNRASLMQALEAEVNRGGPEAERVVIFIDFDGFKQINDRLGHAAGDELLTIAARRIRDAIREYDLVGRLGGDEFLVLCPEIAGPEQGMALAERLSASLNGVVQLGSGPESLQVSLGVAWSKGTTVTADALVAQADAAMYQSKRENVGQPHLAETGLGVLVALRTARS